MPEPGLRLILAPHSGIDETAVVTLALANFGRQFKTENRASARPRRHPNPAAVALDDRTADRETHSHATRLGRKQRLEDAIELQSQYLRSTHARNQVCCALIVSRAREVAVNAWTRRRS